MDLWPAIPAEDLAGRGRLAAAVVLTLLLLVMLMITAATREYQAAPTPDVAPPTADRLSPTG